MIKNSVYMAGVSIAVLGSSCSGASAETYSLLGIYKDLTPAFQCLEDELSSNPGLTDPKMSYASIQLMMEPAHKRCEATTLFQKNIATKKLAASNSKLTKERQARFVNDAFGGWWVNFFMTQGAADTIILGDALVFGNCVENKLLDSDKFKSQDRVEIRKAVNAASKGCRDKLPNPPDLSVVDLDSLEYRKFESAFQMANGLSEKNADFLLVANNMASPPEELRAASPRPPKRLN